MARILYTRVSTNDQTIEAQRHDLPGTFDREFSDVGVSGAVVAASRPGFAQLLTYIRDGDELHVAAIDRLGRDAIDVQQTVRALLATTGKTQHGATSMGRPVEVDLVAVKTWREANSASISKTAAHFGCSDSTVKRACRA